MDRLLGDAYHMQLKGPSLRIKNGNNKEKESKKST